MIWKCAIWMFTCFAVLISIILAVGSVFYYMGPIWGLVSIPFGAGFVVLILGPVLMWATNGK